jgi:hypothetical protein
MLEKLIFILPLSYENEKLTKIISELFNYIYKKEYYDLYKVKSLFILSLYGNYLTNFKDNKELKFLIDYTLSNRNKIIKFLNYGNFNFINNEKILHKLYVTLTTFNDSHIPPRICISDQDLHIIIYSKYLDYKNNRSKIALKEYVEYLEKYLNLLEKEGEQNLYNDGYFDIHKKLKILRSCIDLLNYKKSYPIIKLLSDVLLSYFKTVDKYKLSFDLIIDFYSIISSDNFLLNYDISQFKFLFLDKINNNLKIKENNHQEKLIELEQLVILFYYIDKLYCNVSGDNSLNNLFYEKLNYFDNSNSNKDNDLINITKLYINCCYLKKAKENEKIINKLKHLYNNNNNENNIIKLIKLISNNDKSEPFDRSNIDINDTILALDKEINQINKIKYILMIKYFILINKNLINKEKVLKNNLELSYYLDQIYNYE